MLQNGMRPNGTRKWRCQVKNTARLAVRPSRPRQAEYYLTFRRRLRNRILRDTARIKELEAQLNA